MHSGRSILVTGAASGIGKSAARRFAEEGGRVCVADLNGEGAEATARLIREAGGDACSCQVDISNEDDNERMVAHVIAQYGAIDVAFLNAGFHGPKIPFFDITLADFDRIVGTNLRGCFLGLQAVGRHIRSGGAIAVTASAAGVTGHSQNAVYGASKHGVVGLVRSAAEAFAGRGVRVNAICPGGVNTPMNVPQGVPDFHVAPDELRMPAFRGMAEAQHIAELAVYLTSHRAAFITGSVQLIDGGLSSSFIK